MKFNIEVKEELSRLVSIDAPDAGEAQRIVRAMYKNSEIVLNYNDLVGEASFELLEGEAGDDFPVNINI